MDRMRVRPVHAVGRQGQEAGVLGSPSFICPEAARMHGTCPVVMRWCVVQNVSHLLFGMDGVLGQEERGLLDIMRRRPVLKGEKEMPGLPLPHH